LFRHGTTKPYLSQAPARITCIVLRRSWSVRAPGTSW